MSRVFVSKFEVNQWHEGFGDCGVDEVYMGRAVLGTSAAMWYKVGCGLSWGGVILDDGNRCRIIITGRRGCVVLLCGSMLGKLLGVPHVDGFVVHVLELCWGGGCKCWQR